MWPLKPLSHPLALLCMLDTGHICVQHTHAYQHLDLVFVLDTTHAQRWRVTHALPAVQLSCLCDLPEPSAPHSVSPWLPASHCPCMCAYRAVFAWGSTTDTAVDCG